MTENHLIVERNARTDKLASELTDMVIAALIDEATLTPKPGLVDMRSPGAHEDMSWSLMCDSALALRPTFCAMAEAGMQQYPARRLREIIGALGRAGEVRMMEVTNGVNTHRGAIWALGLLITAAAQNASTSNVGVITQRAAQLAQIDDQYAPKFTDNKGEQACFKYQVGGAKAQAQAGFPLVVEYALPVLHHSRQQGAKESCAKLNALLSIMAVLDDTCILSRGGIKALHAVQSGARQVLELGGMKTSLGNAALNSLEAEMLRQRLSPGGSADMLAATLFLDNLMKKSASRRPDSNYQFQTNAR